MGYNITKATFKANSTLDWHKHSSAQVLIIVDGEAYYQERGKEPVILKTGDVIKCEKDIEHWHSSTKFNDVTYLALYGGGQPTTWTEVVTQEYYDEKWLIISVGLSRSGDINLERLVLSEETGLKKWDKIVLIDIHFSKYLDINAT